MQAVLKAVPKRRTSRARIHKWDDAWLRWQAERMHRADGTIKREDALLKWLRPRLTRKPLERITRPMLADIRSDALKAGWQARSVNYVTGLVASILRACVEWGWLTTAPALRPLPQPQSRVRWLRTDDAARLVAGLPSHLADAAEFTLETGLRKRTLTRMEWDMVHWDSRAIYIPGNLMKQKHPLVVPLSDTALAILQRRALEGGCWVFSYRGKRIGEPGGRVWRETLKRLDIHNFHWHDLRHTWASWHVQSGTTLAELQVLGGWKTIQMVTVYAHLNVTQLSSAAAKMNAWRGQSAARISA